MRRLFFWVAAMAAVAPGGAHPQTYPSKPVRFVTGAVGASIDVVARLVADGVAGPLGQPVVIDNRGAGVLATEVVSRAPPDGQTVLFFTSSVWIAPLLQKVSYDPIRDLLAVTLVDRSVNMLVVHPSVPARTVKELIALAKARPGDLNYASGVPGSGSHLAALLFNSMAGIKITVVPYKGASQQLADLLSGEVQLTFTTPQSVRDQLKAGRLKAIGVGSTTPSALAPGLPPISASVPGYESEQVHGVFVPAGTVRPIIDRLNVEIVRVLKRPDVKEKLFAIGIESAGTSAEDFAAYVKSDISRLSKVIRGAGIRVE